MKLSEELTWRGLANQTTYADLTALDGQPITFYWGVDPSASSMQVGNLAIAMMVRHFIEHGHKAVLLVGGATGLIGDPDGKATERDLQTVEQVESNKKSIIKQYKQIFAGQDFTVVDNFDWFKNMNYLEFLRGAGKHVPLRQMLGREFVQSRLGEGGAGISYAEFSYVMIQAYDFLYLHNNKGVNLQVCGADQWGNCIAGVDLVRRVTGDEVNIWSAPLVVNKSTGKKFGKSESGAVWLDPQLTSPYQFYQFWLNTDDESVGDFLKIYTLLKPEVIDHTIKVFNDARHERRAQKLLAYEATKLVHGEQAADAARNVTKSLFEKGDYADLSATELQIIADEFTSFRYEDDSNWSIVLLLVELQLAPSLSEAKRLKSSGAISVNGTKCADDKNELALEDFLAGRYAIIRKGKNQFAVVVKD